MSKLELKNNKTLGGKDIHKYSVTQIEDMILDEIARRQKVDDLGGIVEAGMCYPSKYLMHRYNETQHNISVLYGVLDEVAKENGLL